MTCVEKIVALVALLTNTVPNALTVSNRLGRRGGGTGRLGVVVEGVEVIVVGGLGIEVIGGLGVESVDVVVGIESTSIDGHSISRSSTLLT